VEKLWKIDANLKVMEKLKNDKKFRRVKKGTNFLKLFNVSKRKSSNLSTLLYLCHQQ